MCQQKQTRKSSAGDRESKKEGNLGDMSRKQVNENRFKTFKEQSSFKGFDKGSHKDFKETQKHTIRKSKRFSTSTKESDINKKTRPRTMENTNKGPIIECTVELNRQTETENFFTHKVKSGKEDNL